MSETETAAPMDDKALFDAAIATEAPAQAEVAAQEAAPEQSQDAGQARDEAGRFAAKTEQQPAVQPAEQTQQPDNSAQIPAWRVSEIAEARRAAEARASENERRADELERQNRQFQAQLRQLTEKPPEPIDPYVDPEKFTDQRTRQAIDPIAKQMADTREYFSRKDAIRTYGQETVVNAYKAFEQATRTGDPRVAGLVQRVLGGPDPFEDIVSWHKRETALTTVGGDPNAWFEKELERRSKEDPEFQAKYPALRAAQPAPAQNGAVPSVVKLPPSLNRQPGAAAATQNGSLSNEDLYRFATS
jgi:hypothetical protein